LGEKCVNPQHFHREDKSDKIGRVSDPEAQKKQEEFLPQIAAASEIPVLVQDKRDQKTRSVSRHVAQKITGPAKFQKDVDN
jgi:hypothetical protein